MGNKKMRKWTIIANWTKVTTIHYTGYRRDIDIPTTVIIVSNINLNNYSFQALKETISITKILLGLNNSVLTRILAIGYSHL